jgi:Patatin-like phospholipase
MDVEEQTAPFEIGLVMAGAISAGAYTAGVIDFLIQALDEWYQAKKSGNGPVPPHEVRLSVLSGASAGGITAAVATGALAASFPPVTDVKDGKAITENRLFDSWVNRIDISDLLGSRDLADSTQPVVSLLDSTVLQKIADSALDIRPTGRPRPYVSDILHTIVTVSNLRGVPYEINFRGEYRGGQALSFHADHVHFAVSSQGAQSDPCALSLDWQKDPKGPCAGAWEVLKSAALASGAFPLGLAPRLLSYDFAAPGADLYAQRLWSIPTRVQQGEGPDCPCLECRELRPIPPRWPGGAPPKRYSFPCVDGGLMDNEPLELARRILAGADCHNPREADQALRAIVLIDPFPDQDPQDDAPAAEPVLPDLFGVVVGMFNALKNQARFKPEELELAQNPNVFSRFLIGPTREAAGGGFAKYPIACGSLGGFGGFLWRGFREHDFVLGRRNCQRFLKHYFVLDESHALFQNWDPTLRESLRVTSEGKGYLPIVPLIGSVAQEVRPLPWPTYPRAQLTRLREQIQARYDLVTGQLVDQYFGKQPWAVRQLARFVVSRKREDATRYVMDRVEQDLTRFELLSQQGSADA